MSDPIQNAVDMLEDRFEGRSSVFREQTRVWVPREQIVAVCRALRDEHGFVMLDAQSAVDYWPQQDPRFKVFYQLYSLEDHVRLEVRVAVPGNDPVVPSIVEVFPNANWHEREIWDMFGIRFDGHPDPRRILMPYDWEGHPLRKDYPLGYEEVQFTFNYEEIDKRKPYAEE